MKASIFVRRLLLLQFFCLGVVAVALAGCGGSSVPSLIVAPSPNPTATPVPGPSATVSPGPSPQTVVLTGGGYTLTFTLPGIVSGGGTVAAQLTTSTPSNVKAPQVRGRKPDLIGVPLSALVYLVVTPSANITFAQAPSFVYTLPQGTTIPLGGSAYIAYWDPAYVDPAQKAPGWVTLLGPGSVSGQTITFPAVPQNVAFVGGSTYVYALIATTGASPVPVPTATPTPASSGSATPTSGPTATPTPGSSTSGTPTAAPTGTATGAPTATAAPTATPTPTVAPTTAPLAGFCATPTLANTWPMRIQNNTGVSGTVTVYVTGSASTTSNVPMYVTDSTGKTQGTPLSSTLPGFALPSSGCIYLPMLTSTRVYFVLNGKSLYMPTSSLGYVTYPTPWISGNNTGSFATNVTSTWDFLEYTWNPTSNGFGLDDTQVDELGIPISWQAVNQSGALSATYGSTPNQLTKIAADFNTLGTPWPTLLQQTGSSVPRIIQPGDATTSPGSIIPFPTNFWDTAINSLWSQYPSTGSTFLNINYGGFQGYGVVNASTNTFDFYTSPSVNPSNKIYSFNKPSTYEVFTASGNLAPPGTSGLVLNIGRAIGISIVRGTLPASSPATATVLPLCANTDWMNFYGGAATNGGTTLVPSLASSVDWFAAEMHRYAYAANSGISNGLAYGSPDDDECNIFVSYKSVPYATGNQWNVTLNPF